MSDMLKHLTEQDLEEGRELSKLYMSLSKEDRRQAKIYISALSDRNEIARERHEMVV